VSVTLGNASFGVITLSQPKIYFRQNLRKNLRKKQNALLQIFFTTLLWIIWSHSCLAVVTHIQIRGRVTTLSIHLVHCQLFKIYRYKRWKVIPLTKTFMSVTPWRDENSYYIFLVYSWKNKKMYMNSSQKTYPCVPP
jgi:hypothetical protein